MTPPLVLTTARPRRGIAGAHGGRPVSTLLRGDSVCFRGSLRHGHIVPSAHDNDRPRVARTESPPHMARRFVGTLLDSAFLLLLVASSANRHPSMQDNARRRSIFRRASSSTAWLGASVSIALSQKTITQSRVARPCVSSLLAGTGWYGSSTLRATTVTTPRPPTAARTRHPKEKAASQPASQPAYRPTDRQPPTEPKGRSCLGGQTGDFGFFWTLRPLLRRTD